MLESTYYEGLVEAGCDEAGRGCLAGPVFAGAVILPPDYHNDLLNDSKQLTEKKRYELRDIIERDALAWAVGIVSNEEIDEINILRASILAMHRALDGLKTKPQAIIVDGNRFSPWQPLAEGCDKRPATKNISTRAIKGKQADRGLCSFVPPEGSSYLPFTTVVKGDGRYLSIAAASILAKTYRDDFMLRIHEDYPMYRWDSNKGYPAKVHREAIRQYGTSPHHRLSFNLLGESQQLELQFD